MKLTIIVFGLFASHTALAGLLSVTAVSRGDEHTCGLLSDDRVKCWGRNQFGQLGLGDTENRGDDLSEMGDDLPAVDLGGRVLSLSAGAMHTCALLEGGRVKCWGGNSYGQLGLGDTQNRGDAPGEMGANLPSVNLGGVAVSVSSGFYHTCALLEGGRVKCWGRNDLAALGLGDTENRGDEPDEMGRNLLAVDLGASALEVSAGAGHTCALLEDRRVKCWGWNAFGELGLGDSESRGDDPEEMGLSLPAVDLGGRVLQLSVGANHSCVLLDDERIKCWGYNYRGQLGVGDSEDIGDDSGEMSALAAVALGGRAISIVAGPAVTCAQLVEGQVKCWGYNEFGQLGLGDTEERGYSPAQMGSALPALAFDLPVHKIDRSCAIFINGGLKCWGDNTYGQLGTEDANSRGGNPGEIENLAFIRLWD